MQDTKTELKLKEKREKENEYKRNKYKNDPVFREKQKAYSNNKRENETQEEENARLVYHKKYNAEKAKGKEKNPRTKMSDEDRKEKDRLRAASDRAKRTPEEREIANLANAAYMKRHRAENPEEYKARDKIKNEKRKNDPENKKKVSEKRKLRRLNQTGASFHECPICRCKHESKKYDICRQCSIVKSRSNRKEIEVKDLLEENGFHPCIYDRKGPCGDSTNLRRGDFVYDSMDSNYVVIVEVDENMHRNYTPECETSRLGDLKEQYPEKPVFFIRYHPIRLKNPNAQTITKRNKKKLLKVMTNILALPPPGPNELPCGYNMIFIGYDDERIEELASTRERMQHEAMSAFIKRKDHAEVVRNSRSNKEL